VIRQILLACCLLSLVGSPAVAAEAGALPQLTATQIVEKNVAARGGLQAWRAVKTLTFSGEMEAGAKENPTLPFTMKMKRPRKSRLEIKFQGDTAVQVYDGANGWKLRPFLGRRVVEAYTPEEARAALDWQDLDGPLIDYAAKGNKVQFDGTEVVEGHPCYRLKLTLSNGEARHVWIDGQTFLELKMEGSPRRMDGRMRMVTIYLREYRSEGGLMIPHVLETAVEAGKQTHKMTVQAVAANAALDDSLFTKPQVLVAASPLK
jgi:outer membrane lipoprotein-sorting protein